MTQESAPQRQRQYLYATAIGLVVAAFTNLVAEFGWISGDAEDQPLIKWLVTTGVVLVAAGVVWFFNRKPYVNGDYTGNRVLVMGLLSALTIAVFWSGVYGAFTVPTLLLAREKLSDAGPGGTKAKIGGALAVVALVLSLAAIKGDQPATAAA